MNFLFVLSYISQHGLQMQHGLDIHISLTYTSASLLFSLLYLCPLLLLSVTFPSIAPHDESRKKSAEGQLLSLAKALAAAKEAERGLGAGLGEFNGGFGDLPIVVGRSIGKVGWVGKL